MIILVLSAIAFEVFNFPLLQQKRWPL